MTRLAGDPAGAAATACCPRSPAAKDKVRGGNATQLLFPANRSSLDYLDPGLVRELVAGDTIPDRPPGTAWYVVAEADAPRTLVLHDYIMAMGMLHHGDGHAARPEEARRARAGRRAQRGLARTGRPGSAPGTMPESRTTKVPLTRTCRMPAEGRVLSA